MRPSYTPILFAAGVALLLFVSLSAASLTFEQTAQAAGTPQAVREPTEIELLQSTPTEQSPTPLARALPEKLIIQSIGLDSRIIPLGVNERGEMDVPDGKSNDVGWYREGTSPSEPGSAVLDAHVFAAFKHLNRVQIGDRIDVRMSDGQHIPFIVSAARVYRLEELSPELLFNGSSGGSVVHLITCAGSWDPIHGTYDSRLVVFATRAD